MFVILAADKNGVISIVKLQPHSPHVLWGDHEDLLMSQREKVGTFPHLSISVLTFVQNGDKLPLL